MRFQALVTLISLFFVCFSQAAAAVEMAFRCSDVKGTGLFAPRWQPEPDGYEGQSILLHFTGTGIGYVTGFNGVKYPGFETEMNGGFAIVLLGDEFTETHVVNTGSQEFLMTTIRTGSRVLPNSVKAFRGVCRPAANEIR